MSVYSVKGTSFPDRQIFFVFHSQAEKLFLSQPTGLNQEMKVISSIHARQLLAYTCTAALCLFKHYTNKPSLLTLYRQGYGSLTRLRGANSSSALADGHTSGCCRENLFHFTFVKHAATKFFSLCVLTDLKSCDKCLCHRCRLLTPLHSGMWWCLVAAKYWLAAWGEGVQEYSSHFSQV